MMGHNNLIYNSKQYYRNTMHSSANIIQSNQTPAKVHMLKSLKEESFEPTRTSTVAALTSSGSFICRQHKDGEGTHTRTHTHTHTVTSKKCELWRVWNNERSDWPARLKDKNSIKKNKSVWINGSMLCITCVCVRVCVRVSSCVQAYSSGV